MIAREAAPSRFPFPAFPDSWYAVAWSSNVPAATAVPVQAFGRELVAFRTAGGAVHVLDAYCPHLGAHLGHGGTVIGEELRCPFHGWRFAGDGRCTLAPNASRLPQGRPQRSWNTRELHGRIWLWFSNTGAPPAWQLPEMLLDPSLRWGGVGQIDRTFASHPQDVLENAVDPDHFLAIHGMSAVTASEVTYDEHCIVTRLRTRAPSQRVGFPGLTFSGTITVQGYGLGLQTIRTTMGLERLGIMVDTLVIEGICPREDGRVSLLIDIHMVRSLPPGGAGFARRAFRQSVTQDVDADIRIWANRKYLAQPRLTAEDTEIARYRRWAKRFYPPMEEEVG